ncbi:recombination mediator protein UvsY [Candidatus Dojkabacteria bacterium]|jgi:hypothetical protein|nr:recombination mediator protein UvsY [Candidatus Dojkabacteria bacterium]
MTERLNPKKQLDDLLIMWQQDSEIDRTEPGKALLDIPKLHSKYVNILSNHRLMSKNAEFEHNKMKRLKWEYYTGKLDDEALKLRGWEPFPYIIKAELPTYFESDSDLRRTMAIKVLHDEIVDVCNAILKELNSRTFQLRDFIAWERFIQGA